MRLLVIEDDPDLNRQLATALTDAGYVVDRAYDGEEGHFLGESEPYDAVILDIGLPKMDGISVLEAWRRAGRAMPVLILTARDRWSDKVQGFDAGADDYVAKPFHLEEVLARIRALLRRSAGHAKSELNCGPVRLDTRTGRVTVDGNPVKLTSHEYRLLAYLMHHTGRVVSRTELVEHLYDQDFDRDSNTIEVFVGRIRKKLGVDVIQTVRGLGYLLTPPCPMRANSLALRLFFSAAAWTVVILVVTGIVLSSLYRAAVERAFDRRLSVYLRTLVADVATPDEAGDRFPQSLGEPLFELPLSGWYWQVTRLDTARPEVRSSRSLWDSTLPHLDDLAVSAQVPPVAARAMCRARRSRCCGWSSAPSISATRGASWWRWPATPPRSTRRRAASTGRWCTTFAVIGVVLLLITTFQVRFGLAPLKRISAGPCGDPLRCRRAARGQLPDRGRAARARDQRADRGQS